MSRVAAVVLAAGLSRRMAPDNKLLRELAGRPLVAHAVDAALASRARPVVVVTGHEAAALRAALAGRDVAFAHNAEYATGLASSLRAGVAAAAASGAEAVVVCLGDMPWVRGEHVDAVVAAFESDPRRPICAPLYAGRRGHPVLWPARFFPALAVLSGDVGARDLLATHAAEVREVPIDDPAVTRDADTPDALT